MTEISDTFADLKSKNEGALIAYVTAGDPNLTKSSLIVEALVKGGADIVELGIPFSDPIADGPTIQNAVLRSLANGCRPLDVIRIAQKVRENYEIPLVAMTYYNPIFRIGLRKFLHFAQGAGISGMIVPDLPIEESYTYKKECRANDVDTIFLASPSTDETRLKQIAAQTSGYLYLISLYGVTGARNKVAPEVLTLVRQCKTWLADSLHLPFAAGFGISKPEHVNRIIHAGADGVIVGSAFVNIIEKEGHNLPQATKRLTRLAHSLKRATRFT
ncbi:MAG: tryptophan synthase subunit alpha [Candidatus Bathyarchaeia archaeon]|jgi:tryptophan synthase alpha chain